MNLIQDVVDGIAISEATSGTIRGVSAVGNVISASASMLNAPRGAAHFSTMVGLPG